MQAHASDAAGLAFECLPGCGFCCTNRPLVAPHEARALGSLVERAQDGRLRIPLNGLACAALKPDRACGAYEARPVVCRLYPYTVHAGRRIQVAVALACPGVTDATPGASAGEGAARAAELALAQPGASDMVAHAKATFAEYDRRMKEWGQLALPDKMRSAFLPHVTRLARIDSLPAFFAGLAEGDLTLRGKDAVAPLFDAEPSAALDDLLAEAARDAWETNEQVAWVEPGLAWAIPRVARAGIEIERHGADATTRARIALVDLVTAWSDPAADALAAYLRRLAHRDHTEGAAAWIVDQSGYQATPAAAYARVLAEASLHVALRAGLIAAEAALDEVDAGTARRAIRVYETSYHSLPTIGAIL